LADIDILIADPPLIDAGQTQVDRLIGFELPPILSVISHVTELLSMPLPLQWSGTPLAVILALTFFAICRGD
jgi:hypothetical protein